MKNVTVKYDKHGRLEDIDNKFLLFEQENNSLSVSAYISTDKKVRAYIKAGNNNSLVTDEILPVEEVYSLTICNEYMVGGTLYVGYELYDDTGYIERLEPVKLYIESFVSLGTNKKDNVYVVSMKIGDVVTLEPDEQATVENVGTKKDMILNFGIPRGIQGVKGDKGPQGEKGEQGIQGQTGYTPVKGKDYFTPEDIASLGIDKKMDIERSYYKETIDAMINAKADINNIYYRGTIDALLGDKADVADVDERIKHVSNDKDLIDYDEYYNFGVYHLAGTECPEVDYDEESLREILIAGADYDIKSPSFGDWTQTRISNGKILYRDETDAPDDSYYGEWRELYARAEDVDKRIKYIHYDKTDTYVNEDGDEMFSGVNFDKLTESGLYYVIDNRGFVEDYPEGEEFIILLVEDDDPGYHLTQTKIQNGRIYIRNWDIWDNWMEWREVYAEKISISTYEDNKISLYLSGKCEHRLGEISSLILSLPRSIDERYESYFTFISGEIPTSLTYSATPIRWSGDDVDYDGVFIPETNKIYEVAVKYLGDDAEGNPIISARVGVV